MRERIGDYENITIAWIGGHAPEAWLSSGPEDSDYVDKLSLTDMNARELATLLATKGFTLQRIPRPPPEAIRVTTFNGKRYRLFEPVFDFEAAKNLVIAPERLLRIESLAEDDFLHTWLDADKHYWLAGSDENEEGVWTWGENPTAFWTSQDGKINDSFSAWAEGEPNNKGVDGDEDCLVFHAAGAGWADRSCSELHQLVLESPVTEEPSTPVHSQEL